MIDTCRRNLATLWWTTLWRSVPCVLVWTAAGVAANEPGPAIPAISRADVEADWLVQARLRYAANGWRNHQTHARPRRDRRL